MAKVLANFTFNQRQKKARQRQKEPTRIKMVFRILDSWGGRVIEEYPYSEKEKATKKLEEYHRKGLLAYYLQQVKVPL